MEEEDKSETEFDAENVSPSSQNSRAFDFENSKAESERFEKLADQFRKLKALTVKLKEKCEEHEKERVEHAAQIDRLLKVQGEMMKELENEKQNSQRIKEVLVEANSKLRLREEEIAEMRIAQNLTVEKCVQLEEELKEQAKRSLVEKQAISAAFYDLGQELHSRIQLHKQEISSTSWLSKHRSNLL